MVLLSEALNDFSFEDDFVGLFESEVALNLYAAFEVELNNGDSILRLYELIEDVLRPFDLILPHCFLVFDYVPRTVNYHNVLSLKARTRLHRELHQLRLDLFRDLTVVQSFERYHLTEDLRRFEIFRVDFQL